MQLIVKSIYIFFTFAFLNCINFSRPPISYTQSFLADTEVSDFRIKQILKVAVDVIPGECRILISYPGAFSIERFIFVLVLLSIALRLFFLFHAAGLFLLFARVSTVSLLVFLCVICATWRKLQIATE